VTLIAPGAEPEEWPLLAKRQVADRLLDRLVAPAPPTVHH
jgi:hypothetical protein